MADPGSTPAGVRPAAMAGSWYPGEARHLASQLEVMLEAAGPWTGSGRLCALVAPHAGLMYSGPTAAYSYACVEPDAFERVLVLAPNHRALLSGAAADPSSHYETPLGRMRVDVEAVRSLASQPCFTVTPAPFAHEHAIEMQVLFLQQRLPRARLVPVLVGEVRGAEFEEIAAALSPLVDARTLVVVSSDFMHYGPNYGYVPFVEHVPERIRNTDRLAIEAIENHDLEGFEAVLERTGTTICGRRPLGVLLCLAPRIWKTELRHYTTSGEITGDYQNSVSYASLVFCEGATEGEALAEEAEKLVNERAKAGPRLADTLVRAPTATLVPGPPLAPGERRTLLQIARRTLEALFDPQASADRLLEGLQLTPRLMERCGAFVSLHGRRNRRLRGCIGSLEARLPLVDAVAENTRAAAQRDPRFQPLGREEVADVDIEISVLGPLQVVGDAAEIEIGRDGLVICKGLRRGVLLPQVPVGMGWDVHQFLENLCRKADLPGDAWRAGALLERFEAEVFAEGEAAGDRR